MTLVGRRQVFPTSKPMGLKAALPLVGKGPVQTPPVTDLGHIAQFTRQLQNTESMLRQLAPCFPLLPPCGLLASMTASFQDQSVVKED